MCQPRYKAIHNKSWPSMSDFVEWKRSNTYMIAMLSIHIQCWNLQFTLHLITRTASWRTIIVHVYYTRMSLPVTSSIHIVTPFKILPARVCVTHKIITIIIKYPYTGTRKHYLLNLSHPNLCLHWGLTKYGTSFTQLKSFRETLSWSNLLN